MKRALIMGVGGQDGAWLAKQLVDGGYEVHGTSRDAQGSAFPNLVKLGVRDRVKLWSVTPMDFRSVLQALTRAQPDEIYNLSGQSSVGLSFEQPVETLESIATGTLNLLESIRFTGRAIRLYNACSSEMFGDTGSKVADEDTAFRPRSPYAVAKATSFWQVANYREAYGLFACSGILFNHESPLRPERFVTQKIVQSAVRIARGSKETLELGNMDIARDWGWAPEYVDAMWRMLQTPKPEDLVIATGHTYPLKEFVEHVFRAAGLDWRSHVKSNPALLRPSEIMVNRANPARAKNALGWEAKTLMPQVASRMVEAALAAAT